MYKITSVKLSTIESSKIKPFQQAHLINHAPLTTHHAPLTTHFALLLTPTPNNGSTTPNNGSTAPNNSSAAPNNSSTAANNSTTAANNSTTAANNSTTAANNGLTDTNNSSTDTNNGTAYVKHHNLHGFNNFAIAFFSSIENTPQSIARQLINSGLHVLNRKPVIQRNKRQPFFL